jgi:hypothetical protein
MQHARRRPAIWLLALLVAVQAATAFAGNAELRRRERPERIWERGARGRAGADARPIIDATLRAAGLPEGVNNNPWRDLIHQYWRLDQLAQGEPRSYTEGRFIPNAWFTHGARHFLDLALLLTGNREFVRDILHAQGLTTNAAKDQAFRDLLIILIGHDSQQLGFASPREATRERARIDHPFNGGVATAVAYLQNAGTNPAGAQRALMLALAAAGHSKSAVDFADVNRVADPTGRPPSHTRGANVMLTALLAEVNRQRGGEPITLTNLQREQIIRDAQRIGSVLGAMDSLRERGPGTFGAHPTGETMVYRVTGNTPETRVLEVVNRDNTAVVVTLREAGQRGIVHRTFVEYHTVVEQVSFNGTRFDIRVTYADADIPTDSRRAQAIDIQRDFARTGFRCVVRFRTAEGGWGTAE